jgi:uncharacterized membrane-anchored protein
MSYPLQFTNKDLRFTLHALFFTLYVLVTVCRLLIFVLYYFILRKEGEDFEKDFRGKTFKPVLVKGMGFFILWDK